MNEQNDRSIITAIKKMAGTYNADTLYLVTGRVVSVDEEAGTCSVEAVTGKATTNIEGVELQTTVSDGILVIPKKDSEVKVLFSTYTTPFIVQYGEVEKVIISPDLVQFNDGALGGMVKVKELTKKLNALENKVNSIVSTFNSHTHTSGSSGAPTTPTSSPISGTLTPTQVADIENPLIVQ
jgi:aromatic ring-opening dioxygenase LigB subunit